MGIITSVFGTHSDREIKRIRPIVNKVLAYDEEFSKKSDEELVGMTLKLKKDLENGKTLDDILPEAFATVREASYRVLGMKPYEVQVIGGIVLHQGRIAEMKTGEGKTLVATMPVYLNALTGKGVHVVTVNDYLAKRDSEWMGKVYRFLGLSVGLIIHDIPLAKRKEMYACDIVYGTNNEFGFDYLRDNMAVKKENLSQRELNYAIVDEVDSILIDEARTPLIISGSSNDTAVSDMYQRADAFVKGLRKFTVVETDTKFEIEDIADDYDYVVDEKANSCVLTANGIKKAERYFNTDNYSDPDNFELQHFINNALKAHGVFKKDQKYVVMDGEVVIVDDFTGRLMPGRKYSDGLHQAIEAKENVKVARETRTLATITFQNFFRMYNKISGMTGTAYTEEAEFRSIYALDVIQIPTNRPIARFDENDAVFTTQQAKYKAILEAVIEAHKNGQPVLVGTVNVDKSEFLSKLFSRAGIKHNVLNAKNHLREAEIVAQAGRKGAVTIATNMAGRGTDIILGGNAEYMAKQEMARLGYTEDLINASTAHNETDDELILEARSRFAKLESKYKEEIAPEAEAVRECGGLYIIGTERHESRRIDNQLRGRAGRQGDPGKSKFYLSLDDDLLRIFGGDKVTQKFNSFGVDESMEIQSGMITKIIESSQKKLESLHFGQRKRTLEYDDVMNSQRKITYEQRQKVINGEDVHETYLKMVEKVADRIISSFFIDKELSKSDKYALGIKLSETFGELPIVLKLKNETDSFDMDQSEILSTLCDEAISYLKEKEETVTEDIFRQAERVILLTAVDQKWMNHIDDMDQLRLAISMRGVAQHDPVVEYKLESTEMFNEMNQSIQNEAVKILMRGKFSAENRMETKSSVRNLQASHAETLPTKAKSINEGNANNQQTRQPVKRDSAKVGRNDLCPCGSGKKYKNCCGK